MWRRPAPSVNPSVVTPKPCPSTPSASLSVAAACSRAARPPALIVSSARNAELFVIRSTARIAHVSVAQYDAWLTRAAVRAVAAPARAAAWQRTSSGSELPPARTRCTSAMHPFSCSSLACGCKSMASTTAASAPCSMHRWVRSALEEASETKARQAIAAATGCSTDDAPCSS